jgi:sugar transferase (PEP-CTERM/EpsH1 system associated)
VRLSRHFTPPTARPIRVMHVVYALQPGGMEFGVLKLVNGLPPDRIDNAVCSTTPAGDIKTLLHGRSPLFELRRRAGNDPILVRDLYRLFKRERPDIVHTHAWGTLIEGLLAARMARVPVVVHGEHGTLQLRSRHRWVQRRAWAAADQVLSVSSRLAERMAAETRFPLHRIRVIRNGVDLTRFGVQNRAAARAALALDPAVRVAVAVGRLVPVKDHDGLLTAANAMARQGRVFTLLLAGDGPLHRALVERAAALGINDRVRILGHRADIEVVLRAADVFVQSSVSEGLSNTILEAMASALPIVATRVGGADEMVEHGVTGLLVEPSSPAALAAAMGSLLFDAPRARTMGEAGRVRAESEFSLDGMIRRYEALYVRLASEKCALGTTLSAADAERPEVA